MLEDGPTEKNNGTFRQTIFELMMNDTDRMPTLKNVDLVYTNI